MSRNDTLARDDTRNNPMNCGACGGEKDSEGWCANYCTDEPLQSTDWDEDPDPMTSEEELS